MERIWINKIKYSQHKQIHDFLFCGGVVKEGKSPDFRSPEVGISGLTFYQKKETSKKGGGKRKEKNDLRIL